MTPTIRCLACDEDMHLRDARLGQHGLLFYECGTCLHLTRALPHVTEVYDPGVGFEALQVGAASHRQLLGGLAHFIVNGGGIRPLTPQDTVLLYGAQDTLLAHLLQTLGVFVVAYEPRASYWPAISTSVGSSLLRKVLDPLPPDPPISVLVGLDPLWVEHPLEVLAFFDPEIAILSPPLVLGETPSLLMLQQRVEYLTTFKHVFSERSFLGFLDVLYPPGESTPTVQFVDTPEIGPVAVVHKPRVGSVTQL